MPKLRHSKDPAYAYFITTRLLGTGKIFCDFKLAQIVMDGILHGRSEEWYYLYAFVVMPDHMHIELTPRSKAVPEIMKVLKGFSSRQINKTTLKTGSLWQAGYMDFPIYQREIAWQKVNYIEENPVRAGLVNNAIDYPFSSARMHDLLDLEFIV
jgi:REP element-mobilizing transposase RayT